MGAQSRGTRPRRGATTVTPRPAQQQEPDWAEAFSIAKNIAKQYHVPLQELEDIASEAVVRFLTYDASRYDPKRSGAGGYMATRLRWRTKDAIEDWRCQNLDLTATEKRAVHLWCSSDIPTTNLDNLVRYFLAQKMSATTAHRHAARIVSALELEPTEIPVNPSTIELWDVWEDTADD